MFELMGWKHRGKWNKNEIMFDLVVITIVGGLIIWKLY